MAGKDVTFDLSGASAIVTGGTSGLGEAIAKGLAESGASVMVVGRDAGRGKQVVAQMKKSGAKAVLHLADVTQAAQVGKAVDAALKEFGKIDILVNSAGVFRTAPALDLTEAEWDSIMDINTKGTFLFSQKVARHMVPRGSGKIVNVASTDSFVGVAGELAYCASKGAIVQMTRVMAVEWIKQGVYVNAVAPCDFATPLLAPFLDDPAYREWTLQAIPIGRVGQPAELVAAVLYLCSPASNMVVGHTLMVDGGRTII